MAVVGIISPSDSSELGGDMFNDVPGPAPDSRESIASLAKYSRAQNIVSRVKYKTQYCI